MNTIAIKQTVIRVGDKVGYRGAFGGGHPATATVQGLTLTEYPRDKYGKSVQEVNIDDVKANKVVFDLSDGHWCYADQIRIVAVA
jgi:hypothetical protein